jgi:hypothetical protein
MALRHWLESGNAVLLVIAVVGVEMVMLVLVLKGRSRPIILGLVPGLCLMLALRAALSGQGAEWVGFWLTAALPAHLADLYVRVKTAGER